MLLSSEDISQRILGSSAPILFFDTCIFLDILRSPYRDNISVNAIASALSLVKMSENNSDQVWLLTNEVVYSEWLENIAGVKRELEKEVKKIEFTWEQLITAADIILKIKPAHGQKIASLNLHGHLENLSRNLLSRCLIIKQEDSHSVKAMYRVQKCLAPAKKGKPEPKDCLILEAFLDISEKVRNLGYTGKIYFVTSNSSDYGKVKNPFIVDDLTKINAALIDNLQWAFVAAEGIV